MGVEGEAEVATGETLAMAMGEFIAEVGFADAGEAVDGAYEDGVGVGGLEESLFDIGEFGFTADEVDGGERAFGVEGEGEGTLGKDQVDAACEVGTQFGLAYHQLGLAVA